MTAPSWKTIATGRNKVSRFLITTSDTLFTCRGGDVLTYEEALKLADAKGLIVKEQDLTDSEGLIKGNRIAIRRSIRTTKRKSEVLAEEICHKDLSVGDITDYRDGNAQRQEQIARTASYQMKVSFDMLIAAYKRGIRSRWELAEYLDCTEPFLQDAIERYHEKYGIGVRHGDYYILFEPNFCIMKLI
jgi:hypothetical protein